MGCIFSLSRLTYETAGQSNGIADSNHRYWNYNISQAEYLWGKDVKVLCHCYGTPKDAERMKYTFAVYKTFGYEAWDYTHPLHQTIRYTDILDDPFGAFLSRTEHGNGKYEGTFTGCTTDIDVKRHQFQITRDEPEYWFKRGINGFEEVYKVYENPMSFTHHLFMMQMEIPVGQKIPGIHDGYYVVNVIDPVYQYDENGNLIKDDYVYTVQYYPVLSDDLDIRRTWVFDDIFYFYFVMKFKGAVDFLADKPNRYYVYIGSNELDYGFRGEWYDAPFKAQFMIYNQSLFKWDKDAENERDYTNFHYIGNAFLNYELTEGNTMLTYTLKKSVMGDASTKHMSFYFVVEDTAHNYVALIPGKGVDTSKDPVAFPNKIQYMQRRYNLYCPHGYYRSEEIKLPQPVNGATVQCIATAGGKTTVKMFVRVKRKGEDSFDGYEKADGLFYTTDKTVTHIQYAVSLNTTDGTYSPSFTDVRIIPGNELEPEPYQEKTADIFVAVAISEKIGYGCTDEKKEYTHEAVYYGVSAETQVIKYRH